MREHHNASWGFNEFYFENRLSTNNQLTAWGTISSKIIDYYYNTLKPKENNNIIKDIANYSKNRFNYYRCRLLANVTFGKMRKHYKNKKKELKAKIKAVRRFLKS